MESKFSKINDKFVNKKGNSNNGGLRKYMPSLSNNNKKITFCEVVEVGSAIQSYDRNGQLYGIRKDEEIDTWFIGETHAKTQYNLTRWVNKNHYDREEVNNSLYEIKKNSGVWGQGEECRLWKP
ncbi:5784_t:CDS:2 [Diversispora eburnea]|uniref:5784_t:CDS:1 n=1 Tax=Diversispora eburnea TaxID=1213867 RepID=A0A9N9G423_9GLOM|nr:5784_t:CDS:2 [Diversispora eburnea]